MNGKTLYQAITPLDDFFDRCLRQGLIEKASYGYYFTPEFFELLEKESKKKNTTKQKRVTCSS